VTFFRCSLLGETAKKFSIFRSRRVGNARQRPAKTYVVAFNVGEVQTLGNILCNSALPASGRASDEPDVSVASLRVALRRCHVRDTVRHMVSRRRLHRRIHFVCRPVLRSF
jgi:hypothetical protein